MTRSDEEWRAALTPTQYAVLRRGRTERPGSSPFNGEERAGVYVCAGCKSALFTSAAKFDSGTGWPSFNHALPAAVALRPQRTFLGVETEVVCSSCGGHLGHVFDDGPRPTGKRFCMNGAAMLFTPA